jgi:hypothetical protein
MYWLLDIGRSMTGVRSPLNPALLVSIRPYREKCNWKDVPRARDGEAEEILSLKPREVARSAERFPLERRERVMSAEGFPPKPRGVASSAEGCLLQPRGLACEKTGSGVWFARWMWRNWRDFEFIASLARGGWPSWRWIFARRGLFFWKPCGGVEEAGKGNSPILLYAVG